MAGEAPHGAEAAGHEGAAHAATSFPPFDASLFAPQLVWFALTFGALYFVMSRVALPRVTKVVETRASTVRTDLDVAAQTSAEADTAKAAAERATAEARAGARKIVDDMRAEMAAALAVDRAEAEAGVAKRAAAAEARIATTREQAMSGVGAIAADLAKDIVAQLAGKARGGAA